MSPHRPGPTPGTTSGPRSGTRVVIIEDHELFAESLEVAMTLEGHDVRRLPIDGLTPAAAASAARALRPRTVLLDLDLGDLGDGTRLIGPLARAGINVVVVTASTDRVRWGECIGVGARKVLSKTRPLNEILSVVRRLAQGLPVMSADEREEMLRVWLDGREETQSILDRLALLTTREQEILAHLMAGHPVREIARRSVVSEATVRTQVKSVLAKLDVSSQLAAVGMAHQVSWRGPRLAK